MRLKVIIGFLLCVSVLVPSEIVTAFETDQYNLPPEPLVDIGDEFFEYVRTNIRKATDKINAKIHKIQICAERRKVNSANEDCRDSRKKLARLKYLRSGDGIAKAIFKEIGDGFFPLSKSSSWIEGHKFRVGRARYKTNFRDSIYKTAPLNYATLSSTIKLHGIEFGTDKIAHIFQQGYDYYKIYKRSVEKGSNEKEAINSAVRWGQKTERTYFGTWVSGVYSNADLAANYAGLKFYMGLTKDIEIGNTKRPATLLLKDGSWVLGGVSNARQSLVKPFISNHLNEAHNPNKYFNVFNFRKVIRKIVRNQSCPQWRSRYPNLSKTELEATTESLKLWNGENYGYKGSKHFITIANTCFDAQQVGTINGKNIG